MPPGLADGPGASRQDPGQGGQDVPKRWTFYTSSCLVYIYNCIMYDILYIIYHLLKKTSVGLLRSSHVAECVRLFHALRQAWLSM